MTTNETSRNLSTGVLRRFFFDREIPVGMALMRIALPLVLLIDAVQRWPRVRER